MDKHFDGNNAHVIISTSTGRIEGINNKIMLLRRNGNSGQPLRHRVNYREVRGISRKSAPIHVIVHYPKTEEGKQDLARRVASVHADMVNQYIQKLNCPTEQKWALLDAVITTAKKRAGDQTR